jgi:hypothetical protein
MQSDLVELDYALESQSTASHNALPTHAHNPEQSGRLAARLLADDPDIKPRHLGDVMSTGKLLSPNVYFQIEMEN